MEEYQIFLNQIKFLTERRQSVTTSYLSFTAAIIAAIAFLFKDGKPQDTINKVAVLLLVVSGLSSCLLWRNIVVRLNILLSWWYTQTRMLEENLPGIQRVITKEYNAIYVRKKMSLTTYEIRIVWLLFSLYLVFSVILIVSIFY